MSDNGNHEAEEMLGWAVMGLIGVVAAVGSTLFLAGQVIDTVAGRPVKAWTADGVKAAFLHPTAGPVAVAGGVFLTAALLTGVALGRHQRKARERAVWAPLATASQVPALSLRAAAERAVRGPQPLRPSLAGRPARKVPANDAGVHLGRHALTGQPLYSGWRDVILAVMGPGGGKTASLTIPATLAAPGVVIATSNKPDLWQATHAIRGRVGTSWTFDPQCITGTGQGMVWNPLGAVVTTADADRLAGHFLQEISGGRDGGDFWTQAAGNLLSALLLGAAAGGRPIGHVAWWLADPASTDPADILTAGGHAAAAHMLTAMTAGAKETTAGIYETARAATQCLRHDDILGWVTPQDGLPELHPAALAGLDTIHLLSKDGAGSAAPLVAALTDAIIRAGMERAEGNPGGRLDPPMLMVLDEAANICKIKDLPLLYSHLGSRGLIPLTILQSYPQGEAVWGRDMDALWSAATVKMVGAGCSHAKFCEDVSILGGEHEIPSRSTSRGAHGSTTSDGTRTERRITAGAVSALPLYTALIVTAGQPMVGVRLTSWADGPCRDQVAEALRS